MADLLMPVAKVLPQSNLHPEAVPGIFEIRLFSAEISEIIAGIQLICTVF